jgi:hypothetical protein
MVLNNVTIIVTYISLLTLIALMTKERIGKKAIKLSFEMFKFFTMTKLYAELNTN